MKKTPKGSEERQRERRSSRVAHSARPEIHGAAHVVLRICRGLPSLRTPRAYRVLERAFRLGKRRDGFRLIEFSVQQEHLHLVVEAEEKGKLSSGMQGLMIRIAKALNRLWRRRIGTVFADRYFALVVKKRAQAWRTIRYVLNNGRKHGVWLARNQPDLFSSGRWFKRWCGGEQVKRPLRTSPVERSQFLELWFLGPIQLDDLPGSRLDSSETIESLLANHS